MNKKTVIQFWLGFDGQDPVLKAIFIVSPDGKRGPMRDFSDSAGRESLRGYIICLLLAKEMWSEGFPKDKLDGQKIIETLRSRKKRKELTFVNTVASLYLSRGRNKGRPPWFGKLLRTVSDPLKAKYRDKKRDHVRIVFREVWADYEWQFFTVGPEMDDPRPLKNLRKFAEKLESGFGKWKPLLGKDFVIEKLPVTVNIHADSLVVQESREEPIAQDALRPCKSSFNEHLQKAKHSLENGRWLKIFNDPKHTDHKLAQLGARIGDLQRLKASDPSSRRSPEIVGDWRWLLESTHQVFFSANRGFPEIGRAFDSLVDALAVIDEAEACCAQSKTSFSRSAWVRDIGELFPAQRIYLFLLYFTYLCIESPEAPRTVRSRNLLQKNTLFGLLDGHPAGINDCFFKFHKSKMFARKGERFRNRYWQEYVIQENDTLQTIIHDNYIDGVNDFAACLAGLRQAHDFLRAVSPTEKLFPIARANNVKTITIVPPWKQNDTYQRQVDGVQNWRHKRNKSD
jgi:hypothetical protein